MKTFNFRKALPFLLVSTLLFSCEKNQPPTCQFVKPADGFIAAKGDIVSISVNADDAEGVISEVRLYINEEGLATLEFPYKYELNTEEYRSGAYTLKVTARDDEGLESSDEIQIVVDAVFSIVTSTEASDITYNSAVAGGSVSDDGGAEISETGVYWDTLSSPETAGIQVPMGQGLGEFTGTLSKLPHSKQIYFKAYAVNSAGISVGEEFSFMTNTVPTVKTSTIKSIEYFSAIVGGEIITNGGETILETGVYWSSEPMAKVTGTRLPIENEETIFSITLDDLVPATTYYIKAFAVNAAGEAHGEELSLTTTGGATVNTIQAISERYKSIILSGEVTDNGGNEVTENGFYLGTSNDPASSGTRIPVGSEMGDFTTTQLDLIAGIPYYYVAFAVNKVGESLGEVMSYIPSEQGTFTDPTDQEVYGTVKIGEQVWMSENLKATRYNDGTEILHIADSVAWSNNTGPAYCWYDNDPEWKDRGALYNWYTVNTGKLCPAGWHVPSDEDWVQLEYYLGMDISDANTDALRGLNEGGMLKMTTLWESPNTGATDEIHFSAMPNGRRGTDAQCLYQNTTSYLWSSTLGAWNKPLRRLFLHDSGQISKSVALKNNAVSVRCVKDE